MALRFLNSGYFAGKVGIGTDSPSYTLATYASTTGSNIVASFGSGLDSNDFTAIGLSGFIASNGATKAGIALKRRGVYGTGELHFLNNTTLDNSDMTLSDSKMMIDQDGNLGIGTTTPSSIVSTSGSNTVVYDASSVNGQDSTSTIKIANRSTNADTFASIDFNTNNNRVTNRIVSSHAGTIHTGFLAFVTESYDGTSGVPSEKMRITGTGNVGIGTDSPTAAKLVVDSNTAPQILVKNSGGGNAQILLEDNSGGTQNASITFDQQGQNTLTIATGYNSPTDLNRINIAPAGNVGLTVRGGTGGSGLGQPLVGIGTSTPTAKLHVAGTGLFTGLVSGITPVAAANFVTKAYVDGSGGGTGPFLPLAGGTMTGDIVLNDGIKTVYGTANDGLWIYHDGSNSYVNDVGTGTLNLRGSTQVIIGGTNGEVGVQYVENAGVGLRHNNVTKLTTESTGVAIVGNITVDSALLSNQENTDIDSAASEVVAQVSTTDYTAAFFDFVVKKTTNVRSGTVYACHDGTSVVFTETSTNDLGDTSDVTLSVDISGTNMRLLATVTSDDWSVKSLIRAI